MKHIYIVEDTKPYYGNEPFLDMVNYAPIICEISDRRYGLDRIESVSDYDNIWELIDSLEGGDIDYLCDMFESPERFYFHNFLEGIEEYFKIKCSYGQAVKIREICLAYNSKHREQWIVNIVSALTLKPWKYKTLHGYCQGDCGYCYYIPQDYIDSDFWEYLEGAIWGGLNELHIYECNKEVESLDELEEVADTDYWTYTIKSFEYEAEEIKAEYSNENTVVHLIKECLIPAYREYKEA